MEVSAKLSFARLSPQKARLVADQIRGMPVSKATDLLTFSVKRAARIIKSLLMSAVANAENNVGLDVDALKVKRIFVDQGATFKRIQARAKGRSCRIMKPTCHITIVVSDR